MRQGGFRLIVEIGGSSAALLGLAEMKTGKQRGVVSAAVLDAPEQSYASAEEPAWRGQSPAPAGALQRGYAANSGPSGYNADAEDDDYHPRRGSFRPTVRGLFRSKGGRIVLASTIVVLLGVLAAGLVVARAYLLRDPRFVIAEKRRYTDQREHAPDARATAGCFWRRPGAQHLSRIAGRPPGRSRTAAVDSAREP